MDKIEETLTRGVEKVYPTKDELADILNSGKSITLYNGIDPTGPKLHLGHMVVFRKLRQFQDLGHHVILLIGDFTATIGDPSGKSQARKLLSREDVLKNAEDYKAQASKILNFEGKNPVEIKYNSEWLSKLSFQETLKLASMTTFAQLIERDMFQQRMKEGKDLFLNEFFYPLLQAYDSVEMNVDLEIGGSDQIFNMLMGRTLMKKMKSQEKFVLATKLLAEPGKEKMGKTEDNLIALDDKPAEIFGKVMSWPDGMLPLGYELLTDKDLVNNNPMESKKILAKEIIAQLYSLEEAQKAQEEFEKVFQKREIPEDILTYEIKPGEGIVDVLVNSNVSTSRAEVKRLIDQGGVEVDNTPIPYSQFQITFNNGTIIKAGKRKFIKIRKS